MNTKQNPRVLLFISTEGVVGRQLLSGIVHYSNLYGPWQFYSPLPFYAAPRNSKKLLEDIREWNPDGAILIEHNKSDPFKEILNLKIPTILSFVSRDQNSLYPTIITDNMSVGMMGAQYFIGHGFRNHAFCGCKNMVWSEDRLEAFCQTIKKAGHHFDCYEFGNAKKPLSWEQQHNSLKKWLQGLKKPVALMACNDGYARDILSTCQSIGITAPDQISVLGVDNDELNCEICTPHLSSISLNFHKSGYEVAHLLKTLMDGEKMAGQTIICKPTHVEIRASSDIIAIEDSDVAAAIRFIRENAVKPIQVSDVANATCVCRRALEIRFRKLIGHSIHKEIRHVRVNKIAEIMLKTDLPLSKIMYAHGLNDKHIARWFKAEKGTNPTEFREKIGT